MKTLTRRALASLMGLTEGQLKQVIEAGEFGPLPPRAKLSEGDLVAWKSQRREMALSRSDYLAALRFAVEEYYLGGTRSDFGLSTRRGAGKFIDDYTRGKLGEIGFAEFLRESLSIGVDMDFEHHDSIPAQDIDQVWRLGKKTKNPPGIRVSIKTTKASNTYLLVPEDEFESADRRSDVYVLMRVLLPEDHVIRELHSAGGLPGLDPRVLDRLAEKAAEDSGIRVQAAGFAWRRDFPSAPVKRVGDLELAKPNRALRTGALRVSDPDWVALGDALLGKT